MSKTELHILINDPNRKQCSPFNLTDRFGGGFVTHHWVRKMHMCLLVCYVSARYDYFVFVCRQKSCRMMENAIHKATCIRYTNNLNFRSILWVHFHYKESKISPILHPLIRLLFAHVHFVSFPYVIGLLSFGSLCHLLHLLVI